MSRLALDRRLDRLANQGQAGDRERIVAELAAQYGLDPGRCGRS